MKIIFSLLLCAASCFAASPAKCYAVSSGNWNDPSIWSNISDGSGGTCSATGGRGLLVNGKASVRLSSRVPGAANRNDAAVINSGVTVHVTSGLGIELGCVQYPCVADSLTINATGSSIGNYGALVHDSGSLMKVHGSSASGNNYAVINQYAVEQYMPGAQLEFGEVANSPNYKVSGRLYIGCLDAIDYPTPFCSGNGGGWATASAADSLNITFATALPTTLAVGDLVEIDVPQTAISGCSYPYAGCSSTVAPPTPPLMPRSTDTGTGKICGTVSTCVVPESTPLCVTEISDLSISVGWPQGGNSDRPYCDGTETAAAISNAGSGNLWVKKPVFVRGNAIPTYSKAVRWAPSSLQEYFDATRTTLPMVSGATGVIVSNADGTGPGRLGDSSLNVTSNNWGATNRTSTPCTFLSIADVTSSGCYIDHDRGLMVAYGFGIRFTGSLTFYTMYDPAGAYISGSIEIPTGTRQYNSLVIGNADFRHVYKDSFASFIHFKELDNSTNRQMAFMFNTVRQCEGLVGIGTEADVTDGLTAGSTTPLQISYNSIFPSGATGLGGSNGFGNINFWSNSSYVDISNNYVKATRVQIIAKNSSVVGTYSNVAITNNNFITDNAFSGGVGLWPGLLVQDNRFTGTGTGDGPYGGYQLELTGISSATTQAVVNRNIFFSNHRSIHMSSNTRYTGNAFLYNWHHTVVVGTENGYSGGTVSNLVFDHNIMAGNGGLSSQALDGFDSGFDESTFIDALSVYNNTWLGHDTCFRIGDTDQAILTLINVKLYNNVCAPNSRTGNAFGLAAGGGPTGSNHSAQQDQETFIGYNSIQGSSVVPYDSASPSSNNPVVAYNRNALVTNANGNYNTDSTRAITGVALQNPSYSQTTAGTLQLVVTSASSMTLAWKKSGDSLYGTPVQLNWTTGGTTYTLSGAATNTAPNGYFVLSATTSPWTTYYPRDGATAPPRPVGCPASYWASFLPGGTNAGLSYMISQCETTSKLDLTPVYATAPADGDTFAIMKVNLILYDQGGSSYVVAAIDARSLPTAAGTYTDSGITITPSDFASSGAGALANVSGLPISFTAGVTGSPMVTEPLPMYGGSAQHVFASTTYLPGGTGWMTSGYGGTYLGAIPPASATVTANLPPSCSLSASPTTINLGGLSTLSVSCTPAATSYTWTNVGFASSSSSGNVSPTSTATYSVVGHNAAGDSSSASATVTVNQPPTCTLTPSPSTINLGGSSTLTANCTPAATSYTWTGTGFASSASSGSVSPSSTATYSVVGHNSAGDSSSASATVTVNQPPTCTLTPSPSTINLGGSSTLTANCTPAATLYTWTGTGFASSTSSGSVSPSSTATYSVVGHNAAGDSSSASATVTVNQPPTCTQTPSPGTINLGGSSTLTATCTPAATSYTWTGTGFASSASSGSVSPSSTASYSVVGHSAAGDSSSASATVTVNQPPTCTLTPSPGTINLGGSSTLTANCTPAATSYTWTGTGFASSASSGSVSPSSTATYSVVGHNAAGDSTSASATVTVNLPPTCSLTPSPGTINLGGSSTLTANCTPAATSYTWTGTGFASSASSGSVSPTSTATYSVVGHNAAGDSSSASATVTVNQPPSCSLAASPATISRGDSSTLTATCIPAATSYAWTNSGFAATASSGSVSPTATTTYSVRGTNGAGSGNTANATVTVNQPAVPVCTLAASPTVINLGDSSTLTASCTPPATSYAWTNVAFASSAASGSVSPTSTTSYSVVGHNAAGDGVSASATVTVNGLVEVTSATQLTASALVLNRTTGKYAGTITVTNTGISALSGPVYVFFTTLPSGVTLPSLPTSGGIPYITIPTGLAVGGTSSPVTITFTDPTNVRIAYTTRRYVVATN